VGKEYRNDDAERNYHIKQDKELVVDAPLIKDNNKVLRKRDYKPRNAECPDDVVLGPADKMGSITDSQQLHSHQHTHRNL
jgi:hypothetical protein